MWQIRRFYQKGTAILLCGILLAGCCGFSLAAAAVPGDLDGDGLVTTSDARMALRIAARLETPAGLQLEAGDLDGDGQISTSEARMLLRVAAHLDALPNVGKEAAFSGYRKLCEKAQAEKPGYTTKTSVQLLDISMQGATGSVLMVLRPFLQQMFADYNAQAPDVIARGSEASPQGLPTAQSGDASILSGAASEADGEDTLITLTLHDFAEATPEIAGFGRIYGVFTREMIESSLQGDDTLEGIALEEAEFWHTNCMTRYTANERFEMQSLWHTMDCRMHLTGAYGEFRFDVTLTLRVSAGYSGFVWDAA